MLAFDMAKENAGTFLLRIEDIDRARARPAWEAKIYEDLRWLGLSWPSPVMRQSERLPTYESALSHLWAAGLLYPCSCNRRDIAAAASAPQEGAGPPIGPDGIVYPGTCRSKPRTGPMPRKTALRLDMALATRDIADVALTFSDTGPAHAGGHSTCASRLVTDVGDIVLARRDMGTSYHLSVVLDDAAQDITQVIRGADLFEATQIHVLLQRLLGLPTPVYHHHRLIRDAAGKRLAKRDDARAIATYRKDGLSPRDIRDMVGLGQNSR